MKADEMRIIANAARMKQIDASKNKVSAEYALIEERGFAGIKRNSLGVSDDGSNIATT